MNRFVSTDKFWQSLASVCHNIEAERILSKIYLENAIMEMESEEGANEKVRFGASAVHGWRLHQEDAHIAIADLDHSGVSLFAVFDGHNGAEVARYAAKQMPSIIVDNNCYKSGDIKSCLQEAHMAFDKSLLSKKGTRELRKIRREVLNRPLNENDLPGVTSGCTSVMALLVGRTLYVANAGDSRCVLSRRGKAVPITCDHKPDDWSEKKRIEKAGGHVLNGRINECLNVSRALGDHHFKRNRKLAPSEQMVTAWPVVTETPIRANVDEFIVLACDGIWNCMSDQRVVDFVRKRIKAKTSLPTICQQLIKSCVSPVRPVDGRSGGDNMTCIVIKFDNI